MALSLCLKKYSRTYDAFSNFEKIRKEKTNRITSTSWKVGKLAHIKSGFGSSIRNMTLRMTPDWVIQKQNQSIFQLNF